MADHENPLDLDGDGDDAIEMCMLFDDADNQQPNSQPPNKSGCCVVFLLIGGSVAFSAWGLYALI